MTATAPSGEALLAGLERVSAGPPADGLSAAVADVATLAAERMRPGGPGWTFGTVLLRCDPRAAELRRRGLALMDRTETALSASMDRSSSGPPRHRGARAARTLIEGAIWPPATLADRPAEWDAVAPATFAALSDRWNDLPGAACARAIPNLPGP